ncbi:MAG: Putrescine transport system permease protein PotI, partial [uncultured Nocardioides sp.]
GHRDDHRHAPRASRGTRRPPTVHRDPGAALGGRPLRDDRGGGGPALPLPAGGLHAGVLLQRPRPQQHRVAGIHPGALEGPVRRPRRLRVPRHVPAGRRHLHGRRDRARHDDGAGDGPLPLPRPVCQQHARLRADGDTRDRARSGAARDLRPGLQRPRAQPRVLDHRVLPHHVLPELRGGHGEGAHPVARPAGRGGGAGPLRQPDADVPHGDAAADPAGHPRRGDAGVLAVLRRLHHHQLRVRQRVDVPQVRLRLGPAWHPRRGQRHRLLHVRHRGRARRRRPGTAIRPHPQGV